MAKTILSSIFDNQELLYKITSGLNVKVDNKDAAVRLLVQELSGAVSTMVGDYNKTFTATTAIANSLFDYTTTNNQILSGFTTERNVSAVVEELSAVIKDIIEGGQGLSLTGLNKKINTLSGEVSGISTFLSSEISALTDVVTGNYSTLDSKIDGVRNELFVASGAAITSANAYTDEKIKGLGNVFNLKGYYDKDDHSKRPPVPAPEGVTYKKGDVYLVDEVNPDTGITVTKELVWTGTAFEEFGTATSGQYATVSLVTTVSGDLHNEITGAVSSLTDLISTTSGILTGQIDTLDKKVENYNTVLSEAIEKLEGKAAASAVAASGAAKAYTDVEIEKLEGKAAASAVAASGAAFTASKDYTNEVSASLSATLTGITDSLDQRITANEGILTGLAGSTVTGYVSTQIGTVNLRIDGIDTRLSGVEDQLSGFTAGQDIKKYIDDQDIAASGAAVTSAKNYADDTFVTKTVFGDVASNTKADNEALAAKYEQLGTDLAALYAEIIK